MLWDDGGQPDPQSRSISIWQVGNETQKSTFLQIVPLSFQPNEDFLLSEARMLTHFAHAREKYIISTRHLLIPTAPHAVLPWLISVCTLMSVALL